MIDDFYDKIFVSDMHLSTRACNYENLTNFLSHFYTTDLYLIGDIIDLWKLKTVEKWSNKHTRIISELIQHMQDKTKVKYIIGNHDEFFKNFIGTFSNLHLMKEDIITINDKKLLITHGHRYDIAIKYFKWLGVILTGIHDILIKKGESTFSLNEYLKKKPAKITKFEELILKDVKKKNLDGVICGHTHIPNLIIRNNLIYANTGDFVTNSSFIVQKNNKLILMAYENNQVVIVKEIEI